MPKSARVQYGEPSLKGAVFVSRLEYKINNGSVIYSFILNFKHVYK